MKSNISNINLFSNESVNLTKIERTRQKLEEELYYMEKEMKSLGLTSPILDANRKNSQKSPQKLNSSSNELNPMRKSSIDFEIQRKNSLPLTDADLLSLSLKNNHDDSSIGIKRITRKGNSLSNFSNEPLHYTPKIRKYSLGSVSQSSINLKNRASNFCSSDYSMQMKTSQTGRNLASSNTYFSDTGFVDMEI